MAIDLPNYRIIEKLGVGAETRIYRARCMRTGKDYAVKIVKLTKPEDASYIELMRSEHAIGSTVDHPTLRKTYELRMMRQRLRVRGAVLFMEYVNGMAMSEKEFKRPLDEILRLFGEAALGYHAMHVAGYVHADIKPNNILVTPDGHVKLIDFGQSHKIHGAKQRIQGTIDYIAPEQVQRGKLDQRTDVFGLGAALHRVLTGRPIPTEMNQTVNLHSQSLVGKRLADVRRKATAELPACIARLIQDSCQIRPEDRLHDMQTLAERISLARVILAKQPTDAVDDVDHEDLDDPIDEAAEPAQVRSSDDPRT